MFKRPKRISMILIFSLMIATIVLPTNVYAEDNTPINTEATVGTSMDNQAEDDNKSEDSTCSTEQATTCAKPVASVNILKKTITIKKGKKIQIGYKTKNVNKNKIVWSSSDSSKASVNSGGVVTVKGGGKVKITAKVKGTDIEDSIIVECKNYYTMRVKTTGYCNCSRCCGKWAGHRTASGKKPRANHTIAVDRKKIKLGTKVKIGNTVYTAEDTGVKGKHIDIYYSSHSKAQRHGVKYKTVKIYY